MAWPHTKLSDYKFPLNKRAMLLQTNFPCDHLQKECKVAKSSV